MQNSIKLAVFYDFSSTKKIKKTGQKPYCVLKVSHLEQAEYNGSMFPLFELNTKLKRTKTGRNDKNQTAEYQF